MRLHPDARGRLGGREGKYSELLAALLTESAAWPPVPPDPDWSTLAGDSRRNKIAPRPVDFGAVAWRMPLRPASAVAREPADLSVAGENARQPLSFYPLVIGNTVLVNDQERIVAARLDDGKPAWGRGHAIYESQLAGALTPSLPPETLGTPRFTMTVFQDKLFARMGSPVTGLPRDATVGVRPGYLVCLDLAAEGRLLWKAEPDEGWAMEGAPLADSRGVYVAMRRNDIRPQVAVACLDAETGRLRWRRNICNAETPARGIFPEITHNLLTLAGGTLYFNTNLGAVAAVAAEDGRLLWVSLYPRDRRGSVAGLAPHWRRELSPCLFDHGTLYVAPADSSRIFAFDAATGQPLWPIGAEAEDATDLLGVAGSWLIAGGQKLYWISLNDEDRGRVKHVWPEGAERPGYGRGILAGDGVLWTTPGQLFVFDRRTAQPRNVIDLTDRGASGGNLLAAGGRLLIATATELIAIGPHGGGQAEKQRIAIGHEQPLGHRAMPEHDDIAAVRELNEAYRLITDQLGRVIVGQQQVIEELLVAMFARGHCLLVGVPGLAKTLMIRTLADTLSLEFRRIQFTPDLMPADITGTEVIQEDRNLGLRELRFLKGPIFGNVILADEINRTPPKTQAALLEAMQEYQITVGGQRHPLSQPFFVLATQNPIEHEGTYPLPEAQLDRFMFNTYVDYPAEEEEFDIVRRTTADVTAAATPTLSGEKILQLQKIVRRVPVADHVVRYAMKLARLTRPQAGRRAAVHSRLCELGRGAAGKPISGVGGEGPGRAARPFLCRRRRRPRRGLSRASPPHRHQFQRRGRGRQAGRRHPPPARRGRRARRRYGREAPARVPVGQAAVVTRVMRLRFEGGGRDTMENGQRLLDARMLARLQALPLRARWLVEGYVSGVHRSPFHGFSIEFAEHREYAPGDDLRYLDWKVFGRTDKYYLKQFEEETNLVCHLLLDTSESMSYRSAARRRRSWNTPSARLPPWRFWFSTSKTAWAWSLSTAKSAPWSVPAATLRD